MWRRYGVSEEHKMNLQQLYAQLKHEMDKLDFDRLWPGFQPLKFALYDDSTCFFNGKYIPKTDEFIANTAIKYQGEDIAIWYAMEEMPLPVFVSKIVHEMFHAFQNSEKWSSFPKEMEALSRYTYYSENLSLRLHENQLLLQLTAQFDVRLYQDLLACRKYRSVRFPYEYLYEVCVEDIEGSANFIEWMTLRQLSAQMADRWVHNMKTAMLNPASFFPVRISCYYSGALFIHAALSAGESAYAPVERPLGTSLVKNVRLKQISEDNPLIAEALKRYDEETEHIIESAVSLNDVVLCGPAKMIGVNLYDARYKDGYITSRYFVIYQEGDQQKTIYGNYIVRMADETTIECIYRWPQ